MTRHEIIAMACEAEATVFLAPYYMAALERFATLVAAHERKECNHDCFETVRQAVNAAVAAERVACAAIANAERAEEFRRPVSAHKAGQYEMAEYIYEQIMERGKQ